jgi:hypothetical protein
MKWHLNPILHDDVYVLIWNLHHDHLHMLHNRTYFHTFLLLVLFVFSQPYSCFSPHFSQYRHVPLCHVSYHLTNPLIATAFILKADSHIVCHSHAVPLPCRAAKGLECVFPIWFTQCGLVWFTLAIPRPCHALTVPFFSRPRHSTAVERRLVGYLPAFGFSRLPRGVPRRLLSEAYQSSSQRPIPTTVKSGSNTLQKGRSVKLLD